MVNDEEEIEEYKVMPVMGPNHLHKKEGSDHNRMQVQHQDQNPKPMIPASTTINLQKQVDKTQQVGFKVDVSKAPQVKRKKTLITPALTAHNEDEDDQYADSILTK